MYSKTLKIEIQNIIDKLQLGCNVEEFSDASISWEVVSRKSGLSEEFIEKFQDKVWWREISAWQTLSENFMTKFQHKIDWFAISHKQDLSEPFIVKFQHKVYWIFIMIFQNVSKNTIWKCRRYIYANTYSNIRIKEINEKYNFNLIKFLNPTYKYQYTFNQKLNIDL